MNKKVFSVVGILTLLLALVPAAVSAAPDLPDYKVIDVGPKLRELGPGDMTIQVSPEVLEAGAAANLILFDFHGREPDESSQAFQLIATIHAGELVWGQLPQ